MKTVSESFARQLIDYAGQRPASADSESQLLGAVAAYNMLVRNGVAYLADEVGMGKTYVALGVMGLLRHVKPAARIMVIAPRENIQQKWRKELQNFVRTNWKVEDNCMKSLDEFPTHPPFLMNRLTELARAASLSDHRDLFLRMGSFSASVKKREARDRLRKPLRTIRWVKRRWLATRDPGEFRDRYARVLNLLMPDIDLLIVDEAHNLRKGFGPDVSNRNRVLGLMLGHPDGGDSMFPGYRRRVQWVLMLSATPFEYDYTDLYRQLDVLGLSAVRLRDASGSDPQPVSAFRDRDLSDADKRVLAGRMLVRRVRYLTVGGKNLSKNLYRREWRAGGYDNHDDPMAIEDPRQRLVVGLIQKKVAEILGDRRFNNAFQIGMLSSFESFLETITKRQKKMAGQPTGDQDEGQDDGGDGIFDGRQTEDEVERRGIDTHSLETVVRSYRREFGEGLPHPKLDATARALDGVFETGDKALVFVRRVATVYELKSRLDRTADRWLERRLRAGLPEMTRELNGVFADYAEVRRRLDPRRAAEAAQVDGDIDVPATLEEDTGGADSFFSWFFRGTGPPGITSGAAFQRNRLSSASAAASTLFEDDYVSWLLERPDAPIGALAAHLGKSQQALRDALRELAWRIYSHRTEQLDRYPRLYVVEAYQAAGLQLLRDHGGDVGHRAEIVLMERFDVPGESDKPVPGNFPPPSAGIGLSTFVTELVKRPELRAELWPDRSEGTFRERFQHRERRRELLGSMARLGVSFIDLYIAGMRQIGTLRPKRGETDLDQVRLARDFLDMLEQQRQEGGFGAYRELHSAADAFHTILDVNFPDAYRRRLKGLPELYGRTLQRQVPVGGMSGGVNKQLVRQFRMPGFPLVLVTTDVLQEGEDLHTFCRNVIHYGVTWTPSAMEQRTGRIDRIGCLIERMLHGRPEAPAGEELIQVYFPHLHDTVEVLQVRTVLERLNRFLQMVHESVTVLEPAESKVNVAVEALRHLEPVPRITQKLESAFPVREDWLAGDLDAGGIRIADHTKLERMLDDIWRNLMNTFSIEEAPTGSKRKRSGSVSIRDRVLVAASREEGDVLRRQPIRFEMKSQLAGSAVLLEMRSPVGAFDLKKPEEVEELEQVVTRFPHVKLCALLNTRTQEHDVWVQGSRLFHEDTTQYEEIEDLFRRVVTAADAIEDEIWEDDEDPVLWLRDSAKGQDHDD